MTVTVLLTPVWSTVMTIHLVGYYRVSTAKQGASGLGLEAQHRAVEEYAKRTGGTLLATYEEIESGKRADRPALTEALAYCRLTGSTLVIAKLDRLARNVAFLSKLMEEGGVDFVACDMPTATTLTIHILAAVAEDERRAISARTKAALGSIKVKLADAGEYEARSGKVIKRLGNPQGLTVSRRDLGSAATAAKARAFAEKVGPTIQALRAEGLSFASIASRLDERHIPPAGNATSWTAMGVKRVVDRVG
jgi:DNA invertase Pin-like site-specific DNA recombinase